MKALGVLLVMGLVVFSTGQMGFSQYNYPSTPQPAPSPSTQPQAGDMKTELKTAITHAGYSADADAFGFCPATSRPYSQLHRGDQGKKLQSSPGVTCARVRETGF